MPDNKLYSNIFLQYAEVIRQATQGIKSPEKLSALLTLPESIWNAVTFDELSGTKHTQAILDHIDTMPSPQRESGRKMIEYWIERKKLKFSHHKWAVEHSVHIKGGELIIRVQARDVASIH